jgi:flagellar FliL protein
MRVFIILFGFLCVSGFVYAGDEEAVPPSIEYLELSPKFTVNLAKPKKYLVVNVQLMVKGDEFIEKVKKHLPALRHELIMLYSGRASADLQTMAQREALLEETKVVIAASLKEYSKSDGFKDVFFTEFLIN